VAISEKEQGEDKAREDFHFVERRAVNNAYAALVGRQYTESQQAFTFEEALDAHIEAIEGKDDPLHPNELNRVRRIRNELNAAVDAIKALPPEAFVLEASEEDVNTEEVLEERTAAKEAANEQAFGS